MVRLRNLMTNEIVIARRSTTSGMKLAYTTVTSVKADFQPLGSRNSQNFDGSFNKTIRFYFPGDAGVQEGDRLRDSNSNFYTVATGGVNRRTHGSIDFLVVDTEQ